MDGKEEYPPDYFMDMDPESLRNDPDHTHSFDTTSGDVEWVGEPDYGMGVVWECMCGETRVFVDEELTDEYYEAIAKADSPPESDDA